MVNAGTSDASAVAEPKTESRTPLIAVCVATYKRSQLLVSLLNGLEAIETPAGYDVELRIVDNDADESAREIVEEHADNSRFKVVYETQPERNIALTRNKALDVGPADLLAFIDDDEVPTQSWLLGLMNAIGTEFDLVIGDVTPEFEARPPQWVTRGAFHNKGSGREGETIGWNSTRTSNTMLRGHWVYERGFRFDERFGKSGAEDTEMFKRIYDAGGVFGAAPGSVVIEHVHREQCTVGWLAHRFWRNGINYERLVKNDNGRHPLLRFGARTARGLLQFALGLPLLLVGRADRMVTAILDLSRAGGGLVGWMSPGSIENTSGYRSSGCEQ